MGQVWEGRGARVRGVAGCNGVGQGGEVKVDVRGYCEKVAREDGIR